MWEKRRVLYLDKHQHKVLISALNQCRNNLLTKKTPTDAIDEVLLKAIDAPTKKDRKRYENESR